MRLRWPYGIALILTALTSAWALQQPDEEVVAAVAARPAARPQQPAPSRPADRGPQPLLLAIPSAEPAEAALFSRHDWAPPPPPPPPPAPPPKPVAPPLPYRFMGRLLQDGKAPEVYLINGGRVLTVQAGQVLDEVYRVDSISNELLTLTYLPLNQQQTLALGR